MRRRLGTVAAVALALGAWLLLVGWPALALSPTGDWTCVPEGRTCTFDSDCCSKNCVSDPKLGKVCKPRG